ncbi:MAG: PqqD family protein [Erythrobacter sp.]|uniref:PqqD family protein n=1 Tax=Erythrobacter sp. TaxID=1042 RepID=UPI0025F34029|nr:PqqD family protein [Erythrobacter sp.]MCM0001374.1 PqqD family protein [Erythrobacter sp.]
MAQIDPALLISGDPEVVGCTLAEGAALLNLKTYVYYSLNEVGAFVWDALAEPASFEGLVEQVAAEFDAPRETVAEDLARLVTQLDDAGLVQCRQP